jgi:hypothetical protein
MELQGTSDMAIIQKFDGVDWQYVGDINVPSVGNVTDIVWAFAEAEIGVAFRAVEVRKTRGKDSVNVKPITPIMCAATIDVVYENEFGKNPKEILKPNLRPATFGRL